MKAKDMEFDPVDYYRLHLKDAIRQNAEDFFNDLVKKSRIDRDENIATAEKYYKAIANDKENEKILARFKAFQGMAIFLLIAGAISAFIGIYLMMSDNGLVAILLLVIGLVVAIGMGLLIGLYLNKKVNELKSKDLENNRKVDALKAKCLAQLDPLQRLMDDKDFNSIVKKTTNAFSLDDSLKPEKFAMLEKAYGFKEGPTRDESVFTCLSGEVDTNPFLRLRLFTEKMQDKVYIGTKVITWTEVVGSGKNRHVVTRSETLQASVTKPAPFYNYATFVVYGNEAAPDLTFHRMPSGLKMDHDQKDIEKLVKDRTKQMEKKAEQIIKKGGSFQPLANTEFESLFGAFDRDNEVQYRLLFTPLAQQNMVELITDKENFGDDFSFFKMHKINIVSSRHGKDIPDFTASMFQGQVDVREFQRVYVNTICNIFRSLFFELSPVLAIPLYQQTDAGRYDPVKEGRHVSDYEAESFVNHMTATDFLHPDSSTPQILKVHYSQTIGDSDLFDVESASFRAIPRVDYVPVFGGDGRMHDVAVQWFEYQPLSRLSRIALRSYSGTNSQFRTIFDEKEEFQKEKTRFRNIVKNKNFVGFQLLDGYNYSKDDDARIGAILPEQRKGN